MSSTKANKLFELHEQCRKFAMEHNVSVVTATHPKRGGQGLSSEELAQLASGPLFIDYIGII